MRPHDAPIGRISAAKSCAPLGRGVAIPRRMEIECNVGWVDRVLRIGGGAALLYGFAVSAVPSPMILGLAPLMSGIMGLCPIYFFAGWSTKVSETGSTRRIQRPRLSAG
jgi:hypothetical protein